MKFNNKASFEISSEEIKDVIFAVAKGFVKVQEWKREQEADQKNTDGASDETDCRKIPS